MRPLLLALLLALPASPAWPRAGGGGGGGGGCFPAGTRILTLSGEVPIEKVRAGDTVLAYSNDRLVQAEVKDFIQKKDRLVKLVTDKGSLIATPEHPLLTPSGFAEVRDLKKGDEVGVFREGRRYWAKIKAVKMGGVAEVYNLEVAPPHTFIAGGFIVHNKGGFGGGFGSGFGSSGYGGYGGYSDSGGYYRSSYGRRRGSLLFDLIFIGIALVVAMFKGGRRRSNWRSDYDSGSGSSGGAGFLSSFSKPPERRAVSGPQLAERASRTRDIMLALSRRDRDFDPAELQQLVKGIFLKVQLAWQARDYSTLTGVMMPYLRASHSAKVEAMRARGERNVLDDLQVLSMDFVHVRCPAEKEGRAFTALITASARDYTISDRGVTEFKPPEPQTFQEYWTFNQLNGSWALARIDQPGELDVLNAPNLPATPQAADAVPAVERPARQGGDADYMPPGMRPAEPAAPAAAAQPMTDGTFERGADYLRSLAPASAGAAAAPAGTAAAQAAAKPPPPPAKPDAQRWNRQKMEIAATLAFESVYEAWGLNDSARLTHEYVSGEALARLRKIMDARKAEGLAFEFKSLFTRRAEVVLTSPAERNPLRLDEFTARITATAVRAMLRNGKVLRRDEAPEPFTEYWVFGRQDESWKLRDILPRMDQSGEDRAQDGAPSPVQIEWYWSA